MHLVYVDDSAQKGFRRGQGRLVGLGGLALAEEHLKPFADDFYGVYDSFGVPHHVEMKWSPSPKNDWFRANNQTALITPMREALLGLAAAHEAVLFASVWDEGAQQTLRRRGPEAWVITFLIERVAIYLEKAGHRGVLVFDKPSGGHKDEDAWITDTRTLTDLGTDYVKPTAIVAPILTAPSHHHPQLQLADLIAGVTVGAIAGSKYALPLMPLLQPLYYRSWTKVIGGAGVKLYPDHICNLYHWVLGDKVVMKGTVGVPMPIGGWWYGTDDGMAVTS